MIEQACLILHWFMVLHSPGPNASLLPLNTHLGFPAKQWPCILVSGYGILNILRVFWLSTAATAFFVSSLNGMPS